MQYELSKVHIQATVLMTADDVRVIDQSGTGDYVTYLISAALPTFRAMPIFLSIDIKYPAFSLKNVVKAIRGSLI